jgi:hypothetical protein
MRFKFFKIYLSNLKMQMLFLGLVTLEEQNNQCGKYQLMMLQDIQKTWNKLAEEGHIKITIKGSPSGNFSNLTGTVIQN